MCYNDETLTHLYPLVRGQCHHYWDITPLFCLNSIVLTFPGSMRQEKEVKSKMFCVVCGTVLDGHNQCINCKKNQNETETDSDNQTNVKSKIAG
ncbi:MAG: hypothetical protein ACFE95_03640 [Candidatus Hodarchaeota archaeon]